MGLLTKFLSRVKTSSSRPSTSSSTGTAVDADADADAASLALELDRASQLTPPLADVVVTNNTNEHHTFVRIECADRIGLLSEIATYLTEMSINVVQADVVRDSRRVSYALYTCEEESRCKLSEEQCSQAREDLRAIVEARASVASVPRVGAIGDALAVVREDEPSDAASLKTRGDARPTTTTNSSRGAFEEERDGMFDSVELSFHGGVMFNNEVVANATELRMQVLDRPGLMADFCKACVARDVSVIRGNLFTVGDMVENCFLLLDMRTNGKVSEKDLAEIKAVMMSRRHRRAISQRMSIPRDADFVPTEQELPGAGDLSGNTQYIDQTTPAQSWEIEMFSAALRTIPAVRHAGLAGLLVEALSRSTTRLVFPAGITVMQVGEGADTFYVVVDGKLKVESPDAVAKSNRLKPGDAWGEEVLTESTPSTAKLVAEEESVLLGITRKVFATVIRDVMSAARKAAYDAIASCVVFKPFDASSLEALSELLVQRGRRAYRAGEVIYREGMQVKMFLVVDGIVERTIKNANGTTSANRIPSGGYFGENVLIGQTELKGVFIAITDVVILTCTQNFVQTVVGADSVELGGGDVSPPRESNRAVRIPGSRSRGSTNALHSLSVSAVTSVPNLLLSGSYSPNAPSTPTASTSTTRIDADSLAASSSLTNVTRSGSHSTVHQSASKAERPPTSPKFPMFKAKSPPTTSSHGALSTLTEENRRQPATSALSPTLATRSSASELKSSPSMPPPQTQAQALVGDDELVSQSKSLGEFDVVSVLGRGMVGLVLRAKHKKTGKVCAIKTMPKSAVVENGEQEHCVGERRALQELRHAPFVCNLFASFQDPWALYLVVEDCIGDMFDLFNKSGLPGIGQVKVYTAQVLLGLEYIHNAGYVYRDMKPENLLLRSDGSITIGDFGFAKKLEKGQRAYTICGTPDYLAPELILHQGCTRAADIWAFGILVFEMIAGFPPFRDRQRRELYKRIVRADFAEVPIPRRMDDDAHDLLTQIFVRDEALRLGIRAPGVNAIKRHPWYASLDWDAVLSGRLRPLHFLPDHLSRDDVSTIRDANGRFVWMNEPPGDFSADVFAGF